MDEPHETKRVAAKKMVNLRPSERVRSFPARLENKGREGRGSPKKKGRMGFYFTTECD